MDSRRLSDIEARLNADGIVAPWVVDEMAGFSALAYVFDADGNPVVANVTLDRARFIANAPDDIRALIDDVRLLRRDLLHLLEVCEHWLNDARFLVPHTEESEQAVEMLRAVIAKARRE